MKQCCGNDEGVGCKLSQGFVYAESGCNRYGKEVTIVWEIENEEKRGEAR